VIKSTTKVLNFWTISKLHVIANNLHVIVAFLVFNKFKRYNKMNFDAICIIFTTSAIVNCK